jgi:thiol-disulfide isomerase/thioredoxin
MRHTRMAFVPAFGWSVCLHGGQLAQSGQVGGSNPKPAVLNATQATRELTRVPVGEKRLLMFWTPTCGPCKPLLADMGALAEKMPHGLSLLGIVQSVDPDLEPPGEWALLRVKQLLTRYKAGFPTCVHSSSDQMTRWHAQGVPLTILVSHDGVDRVAFGGRNGQRLVAEIGGTHVK